MRLTVSLTSEATKKMMMPSDGETPGIAFRVAINPAAFVTKERTRSTFVMSPLSHKKAQGRYLYTAYPTYNA